MGVKGDVILLAGVNEGTESPKKSAKAAKRTFAAGLDLLPLKPENPPAAHKKARKAAKQATTHTPWKLAQLPDVSPIPPYRSG